MKIIKLSWQNWPFIDIDAEIERFVIEQMEAKNG
jgi:hypothetical protein